MFPDSQYLASMDQIEPMELIAQLYIIIAHRIRIFPQNTIKMHSASIWLWDVTLTQILPHIHDDGTISLHNLPAFVRHLTTVYGDTSEVTATG